MMQRFAVVLLPLVNLETIENEIDHSTDISPIPNVHVTAILLRKIKVFFFLLTHRNFKQVTS